jgi:MFS transporter, ACS family, tartrate transporter
VSVQSSRAVASISIETKTIRKVQIRIMPFIFLLYVVAFLDRVNIGFAALTMNKELAITSQEYGLLSGIFFIGYFLFEIPSNLLMHKIGARIWIARILITWGFVAALTGFVHSVHELYIVRFLLGLAEAGYAPGITLYLTYWFPQRQLAKAIALFMMGTPVASILGGPISGLILDHVHSLAISSWRWLLILEGFPAIVCGVLTYFLLPGRPTEATFLAQDEKDYVIEKLASEEQEKSSQHSLSALQALSHRRVWHLACVSFTFQIGVYAILFWMPQTVRSVSSLYSNTAVGFLVMIPYLASLVAMILVSRSSDRMMERRYHAALPPLFAGISLILLSVAGPPWLSIALWSFAAMGLSYNGPFWSLPNEFLVGASAASGIALINSVGSLGGFVGPFVVGTVAQYGGRIYKGLALAGISFFISATLVLLLPKKPQTLAKS